MRVRQWDGQGVAVWEGAAKNMMFFTRWTRFPQMQIPRSGTQVLDIVCHTGFSSAAFYLNDWRKAS